LREKCLEVPPEEVHAAATIIASDNCLTQSHRGHGGTHREGSSSLVPPSTGEKIPQFSGGFLGRQTQDVFSVFSVRPLPPLSCVKAAPPTVQGSSPKENRPLNCAASKEATRFILFTPGAASRLRRAALPGSRNAGLRPSGASHSRFAHRAESSPAWASEILSVHRSANLCL
jgi:hypothetical protein